MFSIFLNILKKSSTYADIYIGLAEKTVFVSECVRHAYSLHISPLKCSMHFQVRLTKWKVK